MKSPQYANTLKVEFSKEKLKNTLVSKKHIKSTLAGFKSRASHKNKRKASSQNSPDVCIARR